MPQRWTDLEPDEEDFLKRFEASLAEMRSRSADCPEPRLLLAARAGVLPEGAGAGVAEHLRSCELCQILLRDLTDPSLSDPTPAEKGRIRKRVFARAGTPAQRIWAWAWRPAPVVATLAVLIAVTVWTRLPARRAEPAKPAAPQPAAALRLEKPPVRLPLAAALVWRGAAGARGEEYLKDLAVALEPYRAGDFAAAARRLEPLAARYAEAAEAHFYLGVCRLFLERNAEAVAPLLNARKLAQGPLAREAGFYLGLAHYRAGRIAPAATVFRELCDEKGDGQAKACTALRDLPPPRE